MSQTKPPVIKEWQIVKKMTGGWGVTGQVYGDVRCADGDYIRTSRLKSVDFEKGIAITKNTTYQLEG